MSTCSRKVGKYSLKKENYNFFKLLLVSHFFIFYFLFLIFYFFVVCCFLNQLGPSHGLLSPGGQENVEGGGGEGKGGA